MKSRSCEGWFAESNITRTAEQNNDQFDQLFSLISRSQQGYRDLIDTFEDLLFSLSIDGKILTENRSFADLIDLSFAEVIGRPVDEFLEVPDSSDISRCSNGFRDSSNGAAGPECSRPRETNRRDPLFRLRVTRHRA